MVETWIAAVDRSVLIWIGMCILLNKRYRWYTLGLYIVLTAIFRYYGALYLNEWMGPLLFAFTFLISNIRKTGFISESMKNFFYLSLVFMTMILSKTWVTLIMYKFDVAGICLNIFRNENICLAREVYVSLFFEFVIALFIFFVTRWTLKKLGITNSIQRIDPEYRVLLTMGIGTVLACYYIVILIPAIASFECSGIIYMQTIYISVLSLITGGLIALYHAIVKKEMVLIRKNATLIQLNNQLAETEEELFHAERSLFDLKNEIVEKQSQLEGIEDVFMEMENMQERLRDFEHGQNAFLIAIHGVIESGDKEAMYQVLDAYGIKKENILKCNMDCSETNQIRTPILGTVRNLLFEKITRAKRAGVRFTVEVTEAIYEVGMDIFDFVEILDIWLNNAIEEATYTEEKRVHISFIPDQDLEGRSTLEVCVSNSFREETFLAYQANEQSLSTKGQGRGRGLRIVKTIDKRYEHISTHHEIYPDKFMQILEIKLGELKIEEERDASC